MGYSVIQKWASFLFIIWTGWSSAQPTIPVLISSFATETEDELCHPPSLENYTMEIAALLRDQVEPYLTQRYGRPECGGPGWTEVINIDFSLNTSSQCPPGLSLRTSPIRSCGRSGSERNATASFTVERSYTNICGTILGVQKGSTDGFGPTFFDSSSSQYVDGIVLWHGSWHGSSFNQGHIWTFAAAPQKAPSNMRLGCPCFYEQWNYRLPSFVSSNYFCESGNNGDFTHTKVFLDDPLWDGKGCSTSSTCCQFNEPPVFYRKLDQSTEDNIQMTIELNSPPSEENIFITKIQLYVY